MDDLEIIRISTDDVLTRSKKSGKAHAERSVSQVLQNEIKKDNLF